MVLPCRLLYSLFDVPLSPTVTSLNLHYNHIPRIEGLTSAWNLRNLDLSSNCISQIEGLNSLTSLRTLNLSCNLITKVEGESLVANNFGQQMFQLCGSSSSAKSLLHSFGFTLTLFSLLYQL